MFPRDRVISSLVKYKIAFDENEPTELLRDKLANFYAQRTLTKSPITLADQAEVAYLLSSSKLGKTTGQVISVNGGLHEAFLRQGQIHCKRFNFLEKLNFWKLHLTTCHLQLATQLQECQFIASGIKRMPCSSGWLL